MGKDGGNGDDKDDNNEDDDLGKRGGYQILASAAAYGLVKLQTCRKEGEGGVKGKVGSNGPGQWKLCLTPYHGTLWDDKVDNYNGRDGGVEKNNNKEEEDKEGVK